jgi:hypothetical protein
LPVVTTRHLARKATVVTYDEFLAHLREMAAPASIPDELAVQRLHRAFHRYNTDLEYRMHIDVIAAEMAAELPEQDSNLNTRNH